MRHGTEDGRQRTGTRNIEVRQKQRMGDKEHRRETGNSGQETRNRDVRQGTEDGRQGTDT